MSLLVLEESQEVVVANADVSESVASPVVARNAFLVAIGLKQFINAVDRLKEIKVKLDR